MEFSAEHRFAGSPEAVASILGDRTFYEELELPDLSLDAVVRDRTDDDSGQRVLVLRYEYTGNLDPMARRLLGGERLTWTQEVRLRPVGQGASGSVGGTLVFRAEAKPDLLHGDARFNLTREGRATVRRLTGRLVVALPVIGRMAEQRIVRGVLARLDVEAEAVGRRLGAAEAR